MTPAALTPRRTLRRRRATGFTLIEVLIVIVIIAILLGLVMVAARGPTRSVQIARVRTEISGLDAALSDFKATFNDYPPSRITLFEKATGWSGSTAEIRRSKAILRRFWPQFSFDIDRDINQDGLLSDDPIELRGAECLVFFLGGMSPPEREPKSATNPSGSTASFQKRLVQNNLTSVFGFSKNPANPFEAQSKVRVGPFFEFQPTRLIFTTQSSADQTLVYLDTIPSQRTPYLYASSYDGVGYENADVQGTSGRLTTSAYRVAPTGSFWKDKSYQIISPGFDGEFGSGGAWTEATVNEAAPLGLTGTARNFERDNITNFHNNTLATD